MSKEIGKGVKLADLKEFSEGDTFELAENISWRDIDGELIVLNLQSGEYYTLNDSARSLWTPLAEGKSIGEIVGAITAEFEAPVETVRTDVNFFVNCLIKDGVLQTQQRKEV